MTETLTPDMLLAAYANGYFPMALNKDDPELYWFSPEERGVLPLETFNIPRGLARAMKKHAYIITVDTAFEEVIRACGTLTKERKETWINQRIFRLYGDLHRMGHCHSVESWQDGRLVGGLYGLRIGAAFFGESMFSRATDASKVALVHLVARLNAGRFSLLDAQFMNPHLETLGATPISKVDYLERLRPATAAAADFQHFDSDQDPEAVLRLASGG